MIEHTKIEASPSSDLLENHVLHEGIYKNGMLGTIQISILNEFLKQHKRMSC
jgi:hypothetical protein